MTLGASSLSVRARLTLWYAIVLSLILLGYSAGVFFLLRGALLSDLDGKLREDVELAEEALPDLLASREEDAGRRRVDPDRWSLELWRSDGALLYSEPTFEKSPLGSFSPNCLGRRIATMSVTLDDGLKLRLACRQVTQDGTGYVVRSARSSAKLAGELRRLLWMLGIGLPFALAVALIGGYALAWRALSPVKRMVEQARKISAQRLGQRLQTPNSKDELGELAAAFNETFARLEKSFEQMRRFTADASHELRTPLAAIRTMGEVTLKSPHDAVAQREVIASMLEETDSLRHLVENLLTLSRADSGQLRLEQRAIDLSELAREAVQHLEVLAEEKKQSVHTELHQRVCVHADPSVLRRAVINLLDNAIKYSPEGSAIQIKVWHRNGRACLEVVDDGPGIPPELHEKVFERFFRVDSARSRPQGGTGLGLSIAAWAVEVNGGRIALRSDGLKGTVFTIEFAA